MRFVLPFSTASENVSVSPESQKALGKYSVSMKAQQDLAL